MSARSLQLIDLSVSVPASAVVTTRVRDCRVSYILDGPGASDIRSAIEGDGAALGYDVTRDLRSSLLRKEGRRITVYEIAATRLEIRVDDVPSLPFSRTMSEAVCLADIVLPIPAGARIEPGRERHDVGSGSWSGDWHLYDCNADDVAELVHDELKKMGLQSGGVWRPPLGGIPRWKVEAYSPQRLVQVGIVDSGDHLDLDVRLILSSEGASETGVR